MNAEKLLLDISLACYCAGLVFFAAHAVIARYRKVFYTVSHVSILAGLAAQAVFFIARYRNLSLAMPECRKYLPVCTPGEALAFYAFCITAIAYGAHFFKRQKIVALINMCAAAALLWWARQLEFYTPLPAPPYQTWWMSFYAVTGIAGYAFLSVGFCLGVMGLAKALVTPLPGAARFFYHYRFPTREELYELIERFVYYGFPLMSAGIVLRMCWSNLAWGDWWQWNGEELWSLCAWLLYMLYLHMGDAYPRRPIVRIAISLAAFCIGFAGYFSRGMLGFNIYKNF